MCSESLSPVTVLISPMMFSCIYSPVDNVSETGGEGGDVLQPRHQPGAGVREDTQVVGRHEEVSESSKAHPGVLQYRTGNYLANFSTPVS